MTTIFKLRKKIDRVQEGVRQEMAKELSSHAHSMYARGLSTEGYNGGYQQALRDVLAHIGGFTDCNSRHCRHWEG